MGSQHVVRCDRGGTRRRRLAAGTRARAPGPAPDPRRGSSRWSHHPLRSTSWSRRDAGRRRTVLLAACPRARRASPAASTVRAPRRGGVAPAARRALTHAARRSQRAGPATWRRRTSRFRMKWQPSRRRGCTPCGRPRGPRAGRGASRSTTHQESHRKARRRC